MTHTENGYNPTALVISDRVFSDGTYCSFRAAYGQVISVLDADNSSTHIDEGMYFMALVKLSIIEKGRLLKTGFVPDKHGSYYPPKDIADAMYDDENGFEGIYRRKDGTFGFNCDNDDKLNVIALQPAAEMLRRVNMELIKLDEEVNEAKEVLKKAGLPLSMIDKNGKKKSIVNRLLG